MGKELVVRDVLSEQMIDAGAKLVERLDESLSNVQAALWVFLPEEKTWEMIVISPLVKTDGPRSFYKRILEANKNADESESIISLNDIKVADTSNPLINVLRIAISTGRGITGIRFSKNTINGTFIEDSYIYRINIST
ncbi:MAG: hypothetical protein FJ110_11800 [Deltaproteobacteria bacterium]|nr:hypothetical protein [Deltaproteobacteria bacterium]